MSTPYPNTALIVNHAQSTITIDRDPNFDDMILIFDGVESEGTYSLAPGKQVYVGSTYGSDMGLCLIYNADEQYMEIGAGADAGIDSPEFQVISDSEDDGSGPLAYDATGATDTSITLTFRVSS